MRRIGYAFGRQSGRSLSGANAGWQRSAPVARRGRAPGRVETATMQLDTSGSACLLQRLQHERIRYHGMCVLVSKPLPLRLSPSLISTSFECDVRDVVWRQTAVECHDVVQRDCCCYTNTAI